MAGRFVVEAVFRAVDQITRPVTRIQQQIGRLADSIDRNMSGANAAADAFLGTMGRISTISLGGITAAAAGVGLLVRQFSKVEDAEAAFTPLIGGAEKAAELVAALGKTAETTPFQFETLAESTKRILPVMEGDIAKTVATLRMLGDTAGGNAQAFESIARGYSQAVANTILMQEDLNQIADAGVPIYKELGKTIGVENVGQLKKMISNGELMADSLEKTFARMTSAGGIFFNGMEVASKTTSGLMSTLSDNVGTVAAELGSILAPHIKDLINLGIDAAKATLEWVKANKELISLKVGEFVRAVSRAYDELKAKLVQVDQEFGLMEQIHEFFRSVRDGFNFIREHGATILKVVAGFTALSLAIKAVSLSVLVLNAIAAANPFVLLAAGLAAAAAYMVDDWDTHIGAIKLIWEDLTTWFNDTLDTWGPRFEEVGKFMSWAWKEHLELPVKATLWLLGQAFEQFMALLVPVTEHVISTVASAWEGFKMVLSGVWEVLKWIGQAMVSTGKTLSRWADIISEKWEPIGKFFSELAQTVGEVIDSVGGDLFGAEDTAAGMSAGDQAAAAIQPQVSSASDRAAMAVQQMVSDSRATVDINVNDPNDRVSIAPTTTPENINIMRTGALAA